MKKLFIVLALCVLSFVAAACAQAQPSADEHDDETYNNYYKTVEVEVEAETEAGVEDVQMSNEERAFAAYDIFLQMIGYDGTPAAWAADMVFDMEMDFSIMTFRMIGTGEMATIMTDENNLQSMFNLNMDADMMGMGMFGGLDMFVYFSVVDGVVVESLEIFDGQEMPGELLDDDFSLIMGSVTDVPTFDIDDIVSVEVEEMGAYTTFRMKLDAIAMSDFIEEAMADQTDDFADMFGEDAGVDVSFGEDMSLILVVYGNDYIPVSLSMTMEMRMVFDGDIFEELDGEEIVMRLSVEYHYTAFGDDVVIESPELGEAMQAMAESAVGRPEIDIFHDLTSLNLVAADFSGAEFIYPYRWYIRPDSAYSVVIPLLIGIDFTSSPTVAHWFSHSFSVSLSMYALIDSDPAHLIAIFSERIRQSFFEDDSAFLFPLEVPTIHVSEDGSTAAFAAFFRNEFDVFEISVSLAQKIPNSNYTFALSLIVFPSGIEDDEIYFLVELADAIGLPDLSEFFMRELF